MQTRRMWKWKLFQLKRKCEFYAIQEGVWLYDNVEDDSSRIHEEFIHDTTARNKIQFTYMKNFFLDFHFDFESSMFAWKNIFLLKPKQFRLPSKSHNEKMVFTNHPSKRFQRLREKKKIFQGKVCERENEENDVREEKRGIFIIKEKIFIFSLYFFFSWKEAHKSECKKLIKINILKIWN